MRKNKFIWTPPHTQAIIVLITRILLNQQIPTGRDYILSYTLLGKVMCGFNKKVQFDNMRVTEQETRRNKLSLLNIINVWKTNFGFRFSTSHVEADVVALKQGPACGGTYVNRTELAASHTYSSNDIALCDYIMCYSNFKF